MRTWEKTLQNVLVVVGRLALGYLFLTQLFWKMPPTFGCPPDFAFTTGTVNNGQVRLQRTSGLCDWIGVESAWASQPRPILVANVDNQGAPEFAVDIGLLARGNGAFIDNFVKPNIRWFGYAIWGMEALIAVSMILGLFGRLGGLVAIAQSAQLWVGLAGIGNPFEWEWTYNMILALSLVMFAIAPGRVFGLDTLIRPRLLAAAEKGNKAAGLLSWLT